MAKFHGNTLSLNENTAKSFRVATFFDSHCSLPCSRKVDKMELMSPITCKKLELQFVSMFAYKFTITSLNFKLRANRVAQQCHG